MAVNHQDFAQLWCFTLLVLPSIPHRARVGFLLSVMQGHSVGGALVRIPV
jgi:hypothetical protein